jgi:stage V sporulation protein D (sporulation-specific penicillin-binding protein)
MCEILRPIGCEPGGTGKNAYVAGYDIGGKTGTSEKTAQEAANEDAPKEYIVSFCGVAPTNDPQVVVLLLLDTPNNERNHIYISGGNMAAPVVGHILSEVLPYLGIQPKYTEEELKTLDVTVPKFAGMTVEEATQALEKLGLTVRVIGDGERITDQLPSFNATVAPNSQILLYAGGTKSPDMMTVPQLYGKSYLDAKKALEELGLLIRSGGTLSTSPNATVTTQSVAAGTEVPMGTIIDVTLIDDSIVGTY